jgi:hypothetical protein
MGEVMLAIKETQEIAVHGQVERLESVMLQLPQAECPVTHYFGPGVYIREVKLPAGVFAIGHEQRFEHLNVMLKGTVAIIDDDGQLKELRAPLTYVGKPGRKIGYVLEDTIWQNVYATNERDIEKLEAMYLRKSENFEEYATAVRQLMTAAHIHDREDFQQLLIETGFSAEEVRRISENTEDQIPMPTNLGTKITIRDSYIEGLGIFLSHPATSGEILAPARLGGYRTPVGRYTNHSPTPNAKYVQFETGDIYLVALRDIKGCQGGGQGEEVTVNYRDHLGELT